MRRKETSARQRHPVTACRFGCGFERDWRVAVVNHEKKCSLNMERDRSACGTVIGHGRHRLWGEEPCDACRAAYNERARTKRPVRRKESTAWPCQVCGIEIMSARPRKFCSDRCERQKPGARERHREEMRRSREKLGDRRHQITCQLCGTVAMVTQPYVKFCSHDCSALWLLEHPELDSRRLPRSACTDLVHLGGLDEYPDPREIVAKRCPYCRTSFEAERRSRRTCCSSACSQSFAKYRRERQFDDGRPWLSFVAGPCAWCRESFVATAARTDDNAPRFCSRRCMKSASKARRGRFVIPVPVRLAIYERDSWMCQLCGDPVDSTLNPSDAWAATLDHIVCQSWTDEPDHSPENLRLAHRWCNSIRSDESHPDATVLFDRLAS